MNPPNLKKLQSLIGITFKNEATLFQALTHRSYLNENRGSQLQSNERIEFLGDAVLEYWTSAKLFKLFPQFAEGDLTNLRALIVCTENLAKVAQSFNLGEFVALSKGEETHGGRLNPSILADTFESIIGAIHLDLGPKQVDAFLNRFLDDSIKQLSSQTVYKDPKSLFQELSQAKRGVTPNYQTVAETGPDHQKTFKVGVYLGTELIATGQGNSKQKAEEDASIKATKLI